ncbi:hypothetical protein F5Y13DRAFT_192631 [Hypoxylon sp. FL1857]|nr:hypothetical protein F5Y13DRAFT_192631 [Hypoxylon sp. FL1857]
METEAYAAPLERERTPEYREPTMTFEPQEYSSPASLRPPGRLAVPAQSHNALLSNLQHQRQQSVPNLSLSAVDTQPRSPRIDHVRRQSQGMPLTGDARGGRRTDESPGRFGGWLSNTSASVGGGASPDTTPKSKRSVTADTTPKSTTPSRFGFIASSMSALTTRLTNQTAPTSPRETDDELCNMDIEAALYPCTSPTDRDTFSPAAYKNLQVNAAGLLHKMQDAYRERTVALREAQAEREAQREEMEETELRIRHFRNQLESMAAKAAEQEMAMQRLVAELRFERTARQEELQREREREKERERERARREKILAGGGGEGGEGGGGEGPLITEDLCVDEEDERKRWRKSDGTVRSDLSSIDTDAESSSAAESESISIFSRSRSPTAMTSITETESMDRLSVRTPPPTTLRLKPAPQLTAFQKLVKGISGEGNNGADGCTNCRGRDSSVAWDTVSLLRDENKSLKHRVAQLEVVVEGALDVVNGIGLP